MHADPNARIPIAVAISEAEFGAKFVVSRAGAGYDARVRVGKSEILVQNHVIDVIPF